MTVQTLAELKAANEAEDQKQALANAGDETEAEAEETEEVEQPESEEDPEDQEEPEEEEDPAEEVTEEWAKPEAGSVPVSKHVEMKHKLKGKLHEADDEIAKLKAENEALRAGVGQPAMQSQVAAPKMPRMEDPEIAFDDEKFHHAMAVYSEKLVEHKLSALEQGRAQKSQQQQLDARAEAGINEHYARANELVQKKLVSAENYKSADHVVRKAVVDAIGSNGENVLDYMIAQIGEGSEKAIYHLGVQPAKLSKLKELLQSEPTGFAALAYLSKQAAELNSAKVVKPTSTLKPDKPLTGGKIAMDNHRKAYDKAVKTDDPVLIMRAKREAKAKGIDTSNW